ncbi:hypothetical protein B0H17DRAFT_1133054 [Mycena rosella]|uniref:Uncharacterized protein n=1 Tax=Mycena rosella TaxID=1033263 RepID=A0AAD7GIK4_MYCRO|nr:hypothetical protein B0H17DRAFT_1133054 [Mycena rosella]
MTSFGARPEFERTRMVPTVFRLAEPNGNHHVTEESPNLAERAAAASRLPVSYMETTARGLVTFRYDMFEGNGRRVIVTVARLGNNHLKLFRETMQLYSRNYHYSPQWHPFTYYFSNLSAYHGVFLNNGPTVTGTWFGLGNATGLIVTVTVASIHVRTARAPQNQCLFRLSPGRCPAADLIARADPSILTTNGMPADASRDLVAYLGRKSSVLRLRASKLFSSEGYALLGKVFIR